MHNPTADEGANRLDLIRGQLRHGWRIDAPVFGRDVYVSAKGSIRAVEFVLRNESGCQMVAVPDGPTVRDFLHQYGLSVVEL